MRVYLIKNEEGIGYYLKDLNEIENLWDFEDNEPETYSITNAEMTEEEFEALPEFDGF